jgi:hypothetical protein
MKIAIEIVKMIKDVYFSAAERTVTLVVTSHADMKVESAIAEAIDKMKATLSTVLGRLRY